MGADEPKDTRPAEVPDDATVVRQSNWAWLWYAVPWGVFGAVSILVDFITFGTLPLVLAVVIIVPRYLGWRRTAYFLTEEGIVVQRGGLGGSRRYELPISGIRDMQVRPGFFGGTLGYVGVYLALRDGQVAVLDHVPARSPLVEHVRTRLDTSAPHEDDAEG